MSIKHAPTIAYSKYNALPIHVAAQVGATDIVRLLAQQGSPINPQAKDGATPLRCAVDHDRASTVMCLVDELKADITLSNDNDKETPLHRAAIKKLPHLVAFLIQRKANINAQTKEGSTPLYYSVLGNDGASAQLLLQAGADVNLPKEDNITPLHAAAFLGFKEMAMLLVEHGANKQAQTSSTHETPYDFAVEKNHTALAQLLKPDTTTNTDD